MSKSKMLFQYFIITIGAIFVAVAINMIFKPNQLITGGVTGFAIILESFTGVPIWLTNIIANIPLFLIGFKVFGFKNMFKTVYATVVLSVILYLTTSLPAFKTDDVILVSIFGGALDGIGFALIFGASATTGGTDTAASLINKLALPHISISKIMFAIDSVVIALGFFVFGIEKGLYALIAVFVLVKVIDSIQEGLSFAKAAFIISEKSEEISAAIMNELFRGVTSLFAKGMYTQKEKNVLLCALSSKQVVRVKEIVREIDPRAFVMVADVREVMGEGFRSTT